MTQQVGLVEAKLGGGRVVPLLASLAFRNSHRGSWFVPLDPTRLEGELVAESASRAGYTRAGPGWAWPDTSQPTLTEREALECLLDTLAEERAVRPATHWGFTTLH